MSSSFNASPTPSPTAPTNRSFGKLAHQPAYQDAAIQAWATAAVTAIAGLHFKAQHR
jgi:hypothetical protein